MKALGSILGGMLLLAVGAAHAADLQKGEAAYARGDYAAALTELGPLAEQGNVDAEIILGMMYSQGEGVSQDNAQAIAWYSKAAEQGDPVAQFNLGLMHQNGQGVVQDYGQAAGWFRKSAAQGYYKALGDLGFMYANGQGVVQDSVVAYALINLSAAQDNSSQNPAANARNNLAASMTSAQIDAGQALTREMQRVGVLQVLDTEPQRDNGPSRSQRQLDIDLSECAAYAAQMVPVQQVQPSDNSGGSNQYVNPFGSYAQGYSEGAAVGERKNMQDACMLKRGWSSH